VNLEEVKNQFPESASEIELLESLGFAFRTDDWISSLDSEPAQIACWLVGKVGGDQDAEALLGILSNPHPQLWRQAATSLSLIATERHLTPLISILATSFDPIQRECIVYVFSFLTIGPVTPEIISVLTATAANQAEMPSVRAQALEGLGNKLSPESGLDPDREAVDVIREALDDAEAEVRFWACFAVGALIIREALPKLEQLARNDRSIVQGWWSVGDEAENAITLINSLEPHHISPS
jgi:HEAT repeat protein